jgi:hypothetical protein
LRFAQLFELLLELSVAILDSVNIFMILTVYDRPVVHIAADQITQPWRKELCWYCERYVKHNTDSAQRHPYMRGGVCVSTDLQHTILSTDIMHFDTMLSVIMPLVQQHADLYVKQTVKRLNYSYSWINLMQQGGEIHAHTDANDPTVALIATYYAQAAESSDLVFIDPRHPVSWPSEAANDHVVRLPVSQGDLVIFDTLITHAVDALNCVGPRMTISTEFRMEV